MRNQLMVHRVFHLLTINRPKIYLSTAHGVRVRVAKQRICSRIKTVHTPGQCLRSSASWTQSTFWFSSLVAYCSFVIPDWSTVSNTPRVEFYINHLHNNEFLRQPFGTFVIGYVIVMYYHVHLVILSIKISFRVSNETKKYFFFNQSSFTRQVSIILYSLLYWSYVTLPILSFDRSRALVYMRSIY